MSNIVIGDRVRIPAWVDDFASFRRWIVSEDFPGQGRYSHLKGDIWVDVTMERIWHNQIKGVIAAVLMGLASSMGRGRYFPDGMFLTNLAVGLSTEPDGMFVSRKSLAEGRVQILQGDDSLEVLGVPDMTLEVVSPTTVHKDTEVLREQYWEAGIQEYWLVQAEGSAFNLDILRYTNSGYVVTRKTSGWVKSKVFGKSFRLVQEPGVGDLSEFRLEMR